MTYILKAQLGCVANELLWEQEWEAAGLVMW